MKRTYEQIENTIIIIALQNYLMQCKEHLGMFSNKPMANDELQMIEDLIEKYRKGKE